MSYNVKSLKYLIKYGYGLILAFCFSNGAQSQDAQRVFMYLNYFQTDDSEYLLAELKYREDRVFYQLTDVPVGFYLSKDTAEILLGTVITDENGFARFELEGKGVVRDTSGHASFTAVFAGNDSYREASRDISTIRSQLSISTAIEDSIKTLTITGKELQSNEKDIDGAEVKVYVKRTYSDLQVAEGVMEDGSLSIEFPDDLPGATNGDLLIIARILEHDDYGTVETKEKVNWGIPVSHELGEKPRALWSRPPIWIIICVTLAFAAAWFHYFLSISKLFKISKN